MKSGREGSIIDISKCQKLSIKIRDIYGQDFVLKKLIWNMD